MIFSQKYNLNEMRILMLLLFDYAKRNIISFKKCTMLKTIQRTEWTHGMGIVQYGRRNIIISIMQIFVYLNDILV